MDPVEITCGSLMLRPWGPYDVESALAALQDPEISRWTTVPSPYTRADSERWCVETTPRGWADGTMATWAVLDATTGGLLGSVGLTSITADSASLGYWTAAEARGRGVISEAAAAACRWGFGALGLHRITWTAEVGNYPSRAVAQKIGFAFEGTRRSSLTHGDGWVDGWVASLLATDPAEDTRPLPAPPTLTDGVVTLRPWTLDDVPQVERACSDPLIAQWLPVPVPYTRADATSYVSDYIYGSWANGTAAELAVTDAVTGELLGAMGLKLHQRRLGFGEIGYWTAPWARGRGAAGRGAALSARWGLSALGLNRVELLADVDNLASQRAAERGGFTREGILRRARFLRDGTAEDMVVFSLTPDDLPAGA